MIDANVLEGERKNLLAFEAYLTAEAVRVAEDQERQQVELDARNAKFDLQVSAYWLRIKAAAQALLPESLRAYVVAGPVDEEYAPMPTFAWVEIAAPCCAPVHLYLGVDDGKITPAEWPLWVPVVCSPDDPDEDGGATVRYVWGMYEPKFPRTPVYKLEQIGTAMVEARRRYNEMIWAEMTWKQKCRAAQEDGQPVVIESEVKEYIPESPEEKLLVALMDVVGVMIDSALAGKGLL
jgi:hypothetical protein